jgi:hypothetical protein
MFETVRALFVALRDGIERKPVLFRRVRLHFVGSTYSPSAAHCNPAMTLARELGVADNVDEHSGRVSYLDALQVLLDSHALMIVGSEEPHYTPSKLFPYILAKKPILAIVHEASSAVRILNETHAGSVVTFSPARPPATKSDAIFENLEKILAVSVGCNPPTLWQAFDEYTTRAAAKKLARVFDRVLESKA